MTSECGRQVLLVVARESGVVGQDCPLVGPTLRRRVVTIDAMMQPHPHHFPQKKEKFAMRILLSLIHINVIPLFE